MGRIQLRNKMDARWPLSSPSGVLHRSTPLLRTAPPYSVYLADSPADVRKSQLLRYLVFNQELGEGLDASAKTGLDRDSLDAICDHLMVRDAAKEMVVGTYRLQSGYRAKGNPGYHSEQFFDFAPLETVRGELLELGRACVHLEYRNTIVLRLFWKGVAEYAHRAGAQYLVGCISLTTQDQNEAIALYDVLRDNRLARREFRTRPQPHCMYASSTVPAPVPVCRVFFAPIWIFRRGFAARQPSTANSKPLIF
jgi:putative hemolysin